MSPRDNDDDDVEVAIIRGPGAKAFLESLRGGGDDDDDDEGEDYDDDNHPGRRASDKTKNGKGGKSGDKSGGWRTKYFERS